MTTRSAATARRVLVFGATWVGLWLVVFLYMIPRWARTDFLGARLGATTRQTAEVWPVGPDYASYFHAGLSWYRDGVLADPGYHWVTNLWPPGMVSLNALVMEIVGLDGRFILALVVITALVWSLVFACGLHMCRTTSERAIFLLGGAALFLTAPFYDWIVGLYFALPTGFALASALLALMSLRSLRPPEPGTDRVWPNRAEVVRLVAVAGPLLALSLLFRVSSLWAIYGVLGTAGVVWLVMVVSWIRRRGRPDTAMAERTRLGRGRFVVRLLLLSAVPMGAMVGWTFVVSSQTHPDQLSYTITVPELAYGAPWRTDEQLVDAGSEWLLATGSNWACRVDESTCAKIEEAEADSPAPYAGVDEYSTRDYMVLAVEGALRDPVDYFRERVPKAWDHWSSDNPAQGFIFLTSTAAVLVAIRSVKRDRDVQSLVFLSIVFFATVPMVTILFYYYYFIPLQVGSVVYLLVNQASAKETWFAVVRKFTGAREVDPDIETTDVDLDRDRHVDAEPNRGQDEHANGVLT